VRIVKMVYISDSLCVTRQYRQPPTMTADQVTMLTPNVILQHVLPL